MSSKRYPEEFKIEAVRQVTDRGHSVAQVADRLGVTTHSLYAWIRKFGPDSEQHQAKTDDLAEIRRLQKELKRVTEERDILKKPRRTSPVSPIEVRLHSGAQRAVANPLTVFSVGRSPQWLLRLAETASFSSCNRGRAPVRSDQAVLAGIRSRVWLPENPY